MLCDIGNVVWAMPPVQVMLHVQVMLQVQAPPSPNGLSKVVPVDVRCPPHQHAVEGQAGQHVNPEPRFEVAHTVGRVLMGRVLMGRVLMGRVLSHTGNQCKQRRVCT